jgi:hypothetical protein
MAKTLIKSSDADLYETDHYRWLEEQAELLREGRLEDIDALNSISEFEELAVGDRASVESHAEMVVEHLLKLHYSPADRPRRGWRLTVTRHRGRSSKQLTTTLRHLLEASLEEVFEDARRAALIGLEVDRVPADRLPIECPYTLEQILDRDSLPENVHGDRRLHARGLMIMADPEERIDTGSLYDDDFAAWLDVQTAALRERRFADLDLDNLIEEVEPGARSCERGASCAGGHRSAPCSSLTRRWAIRVGPGSGRPWRIGISSR